MPFSKCSQYLVVGRISAKGIKNYSLMSFPLATGPYWLLMKGGSPL